MIVFIVFLLIECVLNSFIAIFFLEVGLFDEPKYRVLYFICVMIICLIGWSMTATINTESEKLYVAEFLAQKSTIEMSFQQEGVTSAERLQLVQTATKLNGEFARRKAQYGKIYFIVWGEKDLYDGIELIKLGTE